MKFRILIYLLLFFTQNIFSQNFEKVDQIIKSYPKRFSDIEELANRIDYDFKTDINKVRAVYSWLSINIRYDDFKDDFDVGDRFLIYYNEYDKLYQLNKKRLDKINTLLKKGKGVCLDYSYTFKELCDRLKIECVIITGYSKGSFRDIGFIKGYKDHAWNAVKVNGRWKLIDVTWSAQISKLSKIDSYYFFTAPSEFIKTHFPINNRWQLLHKKVEKDIFFKAPLFYPNYFEDNIDIRNADKGTVKTKYNRVKIIFNNIPNNKKLYYSYNGDRFVRPIVFNNFNSGLYSAYLKFTDKKKKYLTIYSNLKPIISFKVD